MSATYRQVLLDLLLFTNFIGDLKTQKPTKSSMSLLKRANREIKAWKEKWGRVEERWPISILSFSRSYLQDLNQPSKTEKINISHKNLNPHRDHLEGETHRASPFHLTLLIKYWWETAVAVVSWSYNRSMKRKNQSFFLFWLRKEKMCVLWQCMLYVPVSISVCSYRDEHLWILFGAHIHTLISLKPHFHIQQ